MLAGRLAAAAASAGDVHRAPPPKPRPAAIAGGSGLAGRLPPRASAVAGSGLAGRLTPRASCAAPAGAGLRPSWNGGGVMLRVPCTGGVLALLGMLPVDMGACVCLCDPDPDCWPILPPAPDPEPPKPRDDDPLGLSAPG